MERVTLKVLFFAISKELSGLSQSTLEVPSRISFEELKSKVCLTFDLQLIANNIVLAVNQNYFDSGLIDLKDGDEIALNPTEILELVARESCGAISMFAGTTRDNFDGKEVTKLEYEAYEPMAIKEMERICGDARKKWNELEAIAIYHRLGLVPVKEISIFIAISSPHRQASLEALPYMIDMLKMSVPIWKRECYRDEDGSEGSSQWKENAECTWSKNTKAA